MKIQRKFSKVLSVLGFFCGVAAAPANADISALKQCVDNYDCEASYAFHTLFTSIGFSPTQGALDCAQKHLIDKRAGGYGCDRFDRPLEFTFHEPPEGTALHYTAGALRAFRECISAVDGEFPSVLLPNKKVRNTYIGGPRRWALYPTGEYAEILELLFALNKTLCSLNNAMRECISAEVDGGGELTIDGSVLNSGSGNNTLTSGDGGSQLQPGLQVAVPSANTTVLSAGPGTNPLPSGDAGNQLNLGLTSQPIITQSQTIQTGAPLAPPIGTFGLQ